MVPQIESRHLYEQLRPGDRVEVTHDIKVGMSRWTTVTTGTVMSKRRERHGLHYRRAGDDKVLSDYLVIQRDDGELTTVTIDEFTRICLEEQSQTGD